MKTSLTTYDNAAAEGPLRVVSQQWAALGLSLQADRPSELVIDPEALLWCTLEVGRYDPRLFDEVIDWLELNHRKINVARLKALGPGANDIRWRILSAVATKVRRRPQSQGWQTLAQNRKASDGRLAGETSVFLDKAGRALSARTRTDPDFADAGLLRGRFQGRGRSTNPNLSLPGALLLRAKGIFGSDARAYVWAALLTREGAFQASLAEQTGYSKLNVARALAGLVESGICREERRRTAKWYALVDRDAWRSLLHLERTALRWPNWIRLFRGLVHLCRTWNRCNQGQLSEYLFASELRKAFVEARDDIFAGGLKITSPSPDNYIADEFLPPLRRFLQEVFDRSLGLR